VDLAAQGIKVVLRAARGAPNEQGDHDKDEESQLAHGLIVLKAALAALSERGHLDTVGVSGGRKEMKGLDWGKFYRDQGTPRRP